MTRFYFPFIPLQHPKERQPGHFPGKMDHATCITLRVSDKMFQIWFESCPRLDLTLNHRPRTLLAVISDPKGYSYFHQFLKAEFAEENLGKRAMSSCSNFSEFWSSAEEFKKITEDDKLAAA